MKKLKVVALLVVMMCGLVGCKEDVEVHTEYSRHHTLKARTHADYVQMVIDWECARLTKPDKQMNAKETLDKLYPELKDKVLPVIEELGL